MEKEKNISEMNFDKPVKGIISARKCEPCGHHEMGVITEEGEFLPLVPGMLVEIAGVDTSKRQENPEKPFDLKAHLVKLILEWKAKRRFVRWPLRNLPGQSEYMVAEDDPPEQIAEWIITDLGAQAKITDIEKYLQLSQEARGYDLDQFLSRYHLMKPNRIKA